MKSKSFDLAKSPAGQQKTFDFVGLYKPTAESDVKLAEKRKSGEVSRKESPRTKAVSPARERSPNKSRKRHKQEQLDISQINIDGSALIASSGRSSPSKVFVKSSTPVVNTKTQTQHNKVKSIMKKKSHAAEHNVEATETVMPSSTRTKKRNKSVSFMLDDNEEVVIKKTKSEDTLNVEKPVKNNVKDKKKVVRKLKVQQAEKENTASSVNNQDMEMGNQQNPPQEQELQKIHKSKKKLKRSTVDPNTNIENKPQGKKKHLKNVKHQNSEQSTESRENNNSNEVVGKTKKPKKKKRHNKPKDDTNDDEPASKSSKRDPKPDITEDLENLSIGDNAQTLTNLLDEMTVVDKANRKKLRSNFKKNKKPNAGNSSPEPIETDNNEVKEKIKWKRRKWNRDKKGDVSNNGVDTTVIVENLPLSIMFSYKKLLTEHFGKCGAIIMFGVAEVYTTEESKPVFTTTMRFSSNKAAEQALEENGVKFEGSRIRVKRPLPATETTVVLHSYADLTDQSISSAFLGAGKIRSIRHLVKGKKTIGTAFVEFDGPASVERALKMAAGTKIGGKKVHVARFEIRARKEKTLKTENDSAAEADSEDSND